MEYQLKTTSVFDNWLKKLKDKHVKIRILARLDRVSHGNFGDVKNINSSISELRFFFGSGYRIYYTIQDENTIVLLLNGGNKSTQQKDIESAKQLLDGIKGKQK